MGSLLSRPENPPGKSVPVRVESGGIKDVQLNCPAGTAPQALVLRKRMTGPGMLLDERSSWNSQGLSHLVPDQQSLLHQFIAPFGIWLEQQQRPGLPIDVIADRR